MTRLEELDALIHAGWGDVPQYLIPANWADLTPPKSLGDLQLGKLAKQRTPEDLAMTESDLDAVIAFFESPRLMIRLEKFLLREARTKECT